MRTEDRWIGEQTSWRDLGEGRDREQAPGGNHSMIRVDCYSNGKSNEQFRPGLVWQWNADGSI